MSFAPRRGDACRHTGLLKGQARLAKTGFACPFFEKLLIDKIELMFYI
jgi:hypothetical protein